MYPVLAPHTKSVFDAQVPTPAELLDLIDYEQSNSTRESDAASADRNYSRSLDGNLGVSPELLRLNSMDNTAALQGQGNSVIGNWPSPPQWSWPWCEAEGPSPWKGIPAHQERPSHTEAVEPSSKPGNRRKAAYKRASTGCIDGGPQGTEEPAKKSRSAARKGAERGLGNRRTSKSAATDGLSIAGATVRLGGTFRKKGTSSKLPGSIATLDDPGGPSGGGDEQQGEAAEAITNPRQNTTVTRSDSDLLTLEMASSVDSGAAADLSNFTSTTLDPTSAHQWYAAAACESHDCWPAAEKTAIFSNNSWARAEPPNRRECRRPPHAEACRSPRHTFALQAASLKSSSMVQDKPSFSWDCAVREAFNRAVESGCLSDVESLGQLHLTVFNEEQKSAAHNLVEQVPCLNRGMNNESNPREAQREQKSNEASLTRWTQPDTSDVTTTLSQTGSSSLLATSPKLMAASMAHIGLPPFREPRAVTSETSFDSASQLPLGTNHATFDRSSAEMAVLGLDFQNACNGPQDLYSSTSMVDSRVNDFVGAGAIQQPGASAQSHQHQSGTTVKTQRAQQEMCCDHNETQMLSFGEVEQHGSAPKFTSGTRLADLAALGGRPGSEHRTNAAEMFNAADQPSSPQMIRVSHLANLPSTSRRTSRGTGTRRRGRTNSSAASVAFAPPVETPATSRMVPPSSAIPSTIGVAAAVIESNADTAADFRSRVRNSCTAQLEAMKHLESWYQLHESPSPRTSLSSATPMSALGSSATLALGLITNDAGLVSIGGRDSVGEASKRMFSEDEDAQGEDDDSGVAEQ